MGKKTNWTTAEDQTLCRVWLSASDLQLHGGDQKASNFWNVVLELFHQEVESPVERPLNGLKVRWTRINRDSQKFASIFNELQSKRIKQIEDRGEDVGENAAVALLTEQPWIDDAKVIFHRIYNTKFSFETCWKQLRYSTKWMQLFSNSSSYPVLGVNVSPALPSGVTEEETVAAEAAEVPSDTSSEADTKKEEQPAVECAAAAASSPVPSVTVSAPPTNETTMSSTTSSVAAIASSVEASDTNVFLDPNHKRRADISLESFAQIPHHNQLQRLTSKLVDELKRQNDLMEDQNAIALLKISNELILDEDTRQCYHMLRARYLKKACNNSRTSTLIFPIAHSVQSHLKVFHSSVHYLGYMWSIKTTGTVMADDVAAIRQYWGSEQEYSHNELFAIAQRHWESEHRNGGDAAREFVLQIVANRLEEQLLAWLLQSQVNDTIEDIQKLHNVCLHPYCKENGLDVLETMLDTLVTAAVVRAAACDRSAENRMRQIGEIRDEVETKLPTNSRARSALRALKKCVGMSDEVGIWTTFSDLPNVLGTGLFNSQSARALMDEAEQVILLQQAELEATRGTSGDHAGVEAGEGRPLSSDMLWSLAKRSARSIQSKDDQSGVHHNCHAVSNIAIDAVENMTALEAYLKTKPSKGQSCSSNRSPDLVSSDEDVDPSAVELLSSVHISSDKKEFITDDVIEKAVDELFAMKNLDVISVQTSLLLSLQMRLRFRFLDRFESTNDKLVRRIRCVINRLTGKAPDSKHLALLTVLAAFCPTQVVEQCILGARAGVLHQNLYIKVLRASPLLLEWNDGVSHGCETMFECELQQTVLDVCSDQNNFDRESQNVISFLQSVVEIPKSSSVQQEAPVMTVSRLVDKVMNPICCCTSASAQMQLNLYTLVQQLLQHFVTTNAFVDPDHAVLQNSFQLVLGAFCSWNASDLTLRVHVREKLLLLLKNIMELMPGAASIAMLEQLGTPLPPSLWTLLRLLYGNMVNHKFCKGWDDVVLVKVYVQAKSVDDSHAVVPLHVRSVISAVQVLLWELIWNSTLLEKPSPMFSNAETWSLMDAIAGFDLFETDSDVCTIKGSLLIHHAVANIMLECGGVVFEELLGRIIPHLLKYESNETNAALGGSLQLPKWAIEKLFEQSKGELHIPCQLVSTHFEMRYVATCWYLLCAARELVATRAVVILQSLSNVLAAHDRAVSSSQGSLSGTLFCIQWLCFLASTVVELQLDMMPVWPTLRIQLELSLLRLLHQLEQLKGVSTSEAQFSQGFAAAWLAYLPPRQFENVFAFVASRTKR